MGNISAAALGCELLPPPPPAGTMLFPPPSLQIPPRAALPPKLPFPPQLEPPPNPEPWLDAPADEPERIAPLPLWNELEPCCPCEAGMKHRHKRIDKTIGIEFRFSSEFIEGSLPGPESLSPS